MKALKKSAVWIIGLALMAGMVLMFPLMVKAETSGNRTAVSKSTVIGKTNGLYKVGGTWKYYENGVFSKKTGLVQRQDNKQWCYVQNGIFKSATGLVKRIKDGKYFYVKDGVFKKATGLVQRIDNKTWCYVQNGVFKSATGLVKRIKDGKFFYVENGVFKKATGLVQRIDNKKWFYVKDGVFTKATGLVKRIKDGKFFYVENGVFKEATGAVRLIDNGKWCYVEKGVYRIATGVAAVVQPGKNYGRQYFIGNGKIDLSFTGAANSLSDEKIYIIHNGQVDKNANGILCVEQPFFDPNGWFKIETVPYKVENGELTVPTSLPTVIGPVDQMSKEEQARSVANQIMENLIGYDLEQRIEQAAKIVSVYSQNSTYYGSGEDCHTAYGVFVRGEYTCAGSTCALGMLLDMMGVPWTHVNKNLNTHQWNEFFINGKKAWADGQIGRCGYGERYDDSY